MELIEFSVSFIAFTRICKWSTLTDSKKDDLTRELKQKEEEKRNVYALTGFSWEIFHMKKNPRASITVRTESA